MDRGRWPRQTIGGLAEPNCEARTRVRSYSPTALQNYAACPYKFFLQAIHKLAPREISEAIEELDPLQRGSLIHQIQFELFDD